MLQIILNCFIVFILPVLIGGVVRFTVRKMQKPYFVTVGLLLFAIIMGAIAMIVPSHGSEANGIFAVMAAGLAAGAVIAGLVIRIFHKETELTGKDCAPAKRKKGYIVGGVVLATIILSSVLYVEIRRNQIGNKMWDYLQENHYEETEIKSVNVKHSFMNILLSYNEWIIDVVFEDEPTSVYKFTLKDGVIVQSGVSGTTDKEELKH